MSDAGLNAMGTRMHILGINVGSSNAQHQEEFHHE